MEALGHHRTVRRPSLPKPATALLACGLTILAGCGRKGDPIPRPRAAARACEAAWADHRILSIRLPDQDVQGQRLAGLEAVRIMHLPLGTSRPSPAEVLGRGEVLLEQRRPDLPGPGASLRLDLRKAGRGPGWIVVVALRAGQVPGEPSPVLPWLHPAI